MVRNVLPFRRLHAKQLQRQRHVALQVSIVLHVVFCWRSLKGKTFQTIVIILILWGNRAAIVSHATATATATIPQRSALLNLLLLKLLCLLWCCCCIVVFDCVYCWYCQWGDCSHSSSSVLLFANGLFATGPYAIITTAVSTDLVSEHTCSHLMYY